MCIWWLMMPWSIKQEFQDKRLYPLIVFINTKQMIMSGQSKFGFGYRSTNDSNWQDMMDFNWILRYDHHKKIRMVFILTMITCYCFLNWSKIKWFEIKFWDVKKTSPRAFLCTMSMGASDCPLRLIKYVILDTIYGNQTIYHQ